MLNAAYLGVMPRKMAINRSAQILVASMLLMGSAFAQDSGCPIAGKWRSNEAKTLVNMRQADLNEKQRELLSNGVFGRLIVETDCKGYTSNFDGEIETVIFETVKIEGNRVTVSYRTEYSDVPIVSTAVIENDCYSVPIEALGFAEVFCRID